MRGLFSKQRLHLMASIAYLGQLAWKRDDGVAGREEGGLNVMLLEELEKSV